MYGERGAAARIPGLPNISLENAVHGIRWQAFSDKQGISVVQSLAFCCFVPEYHQAGQLEKKERISPNDV